MGQKLRFCQAAELVRSEALLHPWHSMENRRRTTTSVRQMDSLYRRWQRPAAALPGRRKYQIRRAEQIPGFSSGSVHKQIRLEEQNLCIESSRAASRQARWPEWQVSQNL